VSKVQLKDIANALEAANAANASDLLHPALPDAWSFGLSGKTMGITFRASGS
jgi:hypothetical protein